MIRVAICDDDINTLNIMQKFLNRYCKERTREIVHTVFRSPLDLLADIAGG